MLLCLFIKKQFMILITSIEKNLTVNNNANINNSLTVTDETSSKRLVIRC